MDLASKIDDYLGAHKLAWEPTTLRSEASRLRVLAPVLKNGPKALWESLKEKAPYTRKTSFIRVLKLEAWCGGSEYKNWYDQHKKLFKNVYTRRTPKVTYAEAKTRLLTLKDPYRSTALAILKSGVRIHELKKARDGQVVGKGRKVRLLTLASIPACDERGLRKALKSVGFTPHDLRKIAATHLYRSGMPLIDVCSVMGWSDIKTAMSYIPAAEDAISKAKEMLT